MHIRARARGSYLPLADQLLHALLENADVTPLESGLERVTLEATPQLVDMLCAYLGSLEDAEDGGDMELAGNLAAQGHAWTPALSLTGRESERIVELRRPWATQFHNQKEGVSHV
jgi:hypothetical protein